MPDVDRSMGLRGGALTLALALAGGCDGPRAGAEWTAEIPCAYLPPIDAPQPVERCAGSAASCDRRYDELTYLVAHNAMSSVAEGFYEPNQRLGIRATLESGVRGLMLDLHYWDEEVYLCHGVCNLGRVHFGAQLCEIRAFLEEHPEEIVTLILERYVSWEDATTLLNVTGLLHYTLLQRPDRPWPTLREMVGSGRRLVVFTETPTGGEPGTNADFLLPLYELGWDNRHAAASIDEMTCATGRGVGGRGLFLLNHFLTDVFGGEELARQVNHDPFLTERLSRCVAEHGKVPTFIAVDHADIGDGLALVEELNQGSG